jgi:hypothetical protein
MSSPSSPPHRTRYGATNPELVENDLWSLAASNNWSGFGLARHLHQESADRDYQYAPSHSSYRDTAPGPFWSWQRFGRTSTALPDGRVIYIAGEHEDSYDHNFCIYNDVVVEYPEGKREFYLYPKNVFPPTDFHTATLVGDDIILIGSLGYKAMRTVATTQVLKLDTRTLAIEHIPTSGDCPGWISRHRAERVGDDAILVAGGKLHTSGGYIANADTFEINLRSMSWKRTTISAGASP